MLLACQDAANPQGISATTFKSATRLTEVWEAELLGNTGVLLDELCHVRVPACSTYHHRRLQACPKQPLATRGIPGPRRRMGASPRPVTNRTQHGISSQVLLRQDFIVRPVLSCQDGIVRAGRRSVG